MLALVGAGLVTMALADSPLVMARQSDCFEAFLRDELSHLVTRVVEQVVEQMAARLTAQRVERSAVASDAGRRSLPASHDQPAQRGGYRR
jgi:hypothetical protein